MCDSDNTGDKDNHVSVTGHCIYINGCLISWKSRAQKYYSLSSTEAEYVVLSGISCKILFIKMILEFLGEIIEYLISVYSDNVGASYLVWNVKISNRTQVLNCTSLRKRRNNKNKVCTVLTRIMILPFLRKTNTNLNPKNMRVNLWSWIQLNKG